MKNMLAIWNQGEKTGETLEVSDRVAAGFVRDAAGDVIGEVVKVAEEEDLPDYNGSMPRFAVWSAARALWVKGETDEAVRLVRAYSDITFSNVFLTYNAVYAMLQTAHGTPPDPEPN